MLFRSQLSCHIQQRKIRCDGWHRHLFHAPLGGIVPVAIARGQSSAKRLYNPQYRPWHVAIPVGYTLFFAMPFPYGYYISAILIGLGNGHMYPGFLNMFINVAHHNERGTANSSILTSWDFGFGIGILAGGMIAELFDYTAAFWMEIGRASCRERV